MNFHEFKIGQEYQITKDILFQGQIDLGQRNAFFPKGLRLVVKSLNVEYRIVGFVEKNSGVGLDLYPNNPCMQDSLHLIEDVRNITLVPVEDDLASEEIRRIIPSRPSKPHHPLLGHGE